MFKFFAITMMNSSSKGVKGHFKKKLCGLCIHVTYVANSTVRNS